MRFIFHNPHTLWYKMTFWNFISKTKAIDKYEYLFDYLYNDKRKKVNVFLDNSSSSPVLSGFLARFNTPVIEFYTWVLINKLNPFRFKIIKNIEELNSNDALMTFIWDNFSSLSGIYNNYRLIENFKRTKAFKVINLSHYGYNSGFGSKNVNAANIDLFVSENNLTKNSKFFQHYFSWYKKDVYVLPFVPKRRFIKTTKFKDRKNKAMAMGTITYTMADNDFIDFFKDNKLQPMRHEIFNNAQELSEYIDSYIAYINENKMSTTDILQKVKLRSNGLSLINLYKYIKNLKLVSRIKRIISKYIVSIVSIVIIFFKVLHVVLRRKQLVSLGSKERQYYKIDIVGKYNEYRMFVCPEEIIDLPGIGFVEGMACGSAFLGIRDPMYSDLGLIDKVHYIGYDGTLNDMIEKISYYQKHEEELEIIADAGYNFVQSNFNENKVVNDFILYLGNELRNRRGSNRQICEWSNI